MVKLGSAVTIIALGGVALGGYILITKGQEALKSFVDGITAPFTAVGSAISGAGAAIGGGYSAVSQDYGQSVATQNAANAANYGVTNPSNAIALTPTQAAVAQAGTQISNPLKLGEMSNIQKSITDTFVIKTSGGSSSSLPSKTSAPSAKQISIAKSTLLGTSTPQQSIAASLGVKTSQINPAVNSSAIKVVASSGSGTVKTAVKGVYL